MRVTHHQMQALAIHQFSRQARQRVGTRSHERRAQQQIFRRVTAQRQFGRHYQASPLDMGPARRRCQQTDISSQVANGGVDLRERNFHGSRS